VVEQEAGDGVKPSYWSHCWWPNQLDIQLVGGWWNKKLEIGLNQVTGHIVGGQINLTFNWSVGG
jgi:hypothetical protein